jgi:hypothetical protein
VGFTFCTEAEFGALLAKWQAHPPTGMVSSEVTEHYRNHGMPASVPPDA